MPNSIEIKDLRFSYSSRGPLILDDISLAVEEGSRVAIVGQNGSGKTTLSKHLNGLLHATAGSIRVAGLDVNKKSPGEMSRSVGYVFQNPNYQLFSVSVYEEIAFGLKNLGLSGKELREHVEETLGYFRLGDCRDRKPTSFSGGMRKLIAFASIYAMHPQIFVLDEPTTGQDQPGKKKIGALLRQLAAEGCTVVVISHDMNFVADFMGRVVVLSHGKVLDDGTPVEVFSHGGVLKQASIKPPQTFTLSRFFASKGLKTLTTSPEMLAEKLVEEELLLRIRCIEAAIRFSTGRTAGSSC